MNVGTNELLQRAWRKKMIVPGFNIPYLPMLEPVHSHCLPSGHTALLLRVLQGNRADTGEACPEIAGPR